MKIYLADLAHNYFPGLNSVPLNIAYIAAYAVNQFKDNVSIGLFKYADELIKAVTLNQSSIVGLSNYTWNQALNVFVGKKIKTINPNIPIIMGGPNIRLDDNGIYEFLTKNNYVDIYITFDGEISFSLLLEKIFALNGDFTPSKIKMIKSSSCFSIVDDKLIGNHDVPSRQVLDYIPSPYTSGILDNFLNNEFIPLFETNRGCPYYCSYCNWGISLNKKIRSFSIERVKRDLEYVAKKGFFSGYWIFADANFGIYKRDVEIAHILREIYEKYKPFNKLNLWWDKSAQDHMIEISKILQGLSDAYIAFQTFDPIVEKMINRKNISIDRLKQIKTYLTNVSDNFHTDILLGLPGETMESHLNSLNKAIELGFDSIGGGEIRLLKGSRLETDELRKKFGIKTKYRLIQEGFGIYYGEFITEFEESIRSTNWITETEMIQLRILRAVFFGSISIGEIKPLIKYLKNSSINIILFFELLIKNKDETKYFSESIKWLEDRARSEWFDDEDQAMLFFSNPENQRLLLENPAQKLNFDFLANIILVKNYYESFYEHIFKIIKKFYPNLDKDILLELLNLCRKRNYIFNCLQGNAEKELILTFSEKTIKELIKINFFNTLKINSSDIHLSIDSILSETIQTSLKIQTLNIQTISLLLQKYPNFYLTCK